MFFIISLSFVVSGRREHRRLHGKGESIHVELNAQGGKRMKQFTEDKRYLARRDMFETGNCPNVTSGEHTQSSSFRTLTVELLTLLTYFPMRLTKKRRS